MNPHRALLICATERTGSGLLGSALWGTQLCGRPDEYFGPASRRLYEKSWGCSGDDEYVNRVIDYATTPNGVFSAKVHWQHMESVRAWLFASAPHLSAESENPFLRLAPRLHFCWISRRDKARQAISLLRARHVLRFHWRGNAPRPPAGAIEFDYSAVRQLVDEFEEGDARWSEWFIQHDIVPFRVWYEDDLEQDYAHTALRILKMLDIEVRPDLVIRSDYRKQSDEMSERLVQEYREASRANHRARNVWWERLARFF